jgi:hypothetical protein
LKDRFTLITVLFCQQLPFLLCENGRSFVLSDVSVIVNSSYQLITERFRLSQRIRVAKVNHVIAEIIKDIISALLDGDDAGTFYEKGLRFFLNKRCCIEAYKFL